MRVRGACLRPGRRHDRRRAGHLHQHAGDLRHRHDHLQPERGAGHGGGHDGKPFYTDPNSSFGKAAQEALRKSFGKDPVLIREGGSIPIVQAFRDILGVDTLLLGLALADSQIHSPNENFPVENFEAGIRLNQALLEELGK